MKPVLIGMSAWGNHIDTFLKYTLPSLMAEGNLPALAKERDIVFNIHTKKEDLSRLMGAVEYKWQAVCDADDSEKYYQLGHHQNADLRKAKKMGADYVCLMPDYVYSEKCFEGILRALSRGHKAIARLCLSTVMETIIPELTKPLSASSLATLGLMHIHPGIRNWLITPTGYPGTHVIGYVGKDTLTLHSAHLHPVYIANEGIRVSDGHLPIDGGLDEIIDGDIYCPKPEDGIIIVELTPEANRKPDYRTTDMKEFVRRFKWDTQNSLKQRAIFHQATIDPIDRKMMGNDNYWDDKEIAEMQKTVYDALKG